jgi:hypothetical protein
MLLVNSTNKDIKVVPTAHIGTSTSLGTFCAPRRTFLVAVVDRGQFPSIF